VGLTNGLAWTELRRRATGRRSDGRCPGKGKLIITGKLGDVMQESAQAAMSYVRSRAELFGIDPDFYSKIDLHVHVPEGAIPKDGPSAGITMATTSLSSALLRVPVRRDVAMTGEITLRGRVLEIGGLKEKLSAAHRGGIQTVLIPADNRKDLREIPRRVFKSMRIVCVEYVDDVLCEALLLDGTDVLLRPTGTAVEYVRGELVQRVTSEGDTTGAGA
jgi:ATP-dependent Lon protease